jgi:hypothetical protein
MNRALDCFSWKGRESAGVRRLRVTDDGVDLRRIGPGQLVREKRRGEREARVPKGGGGVTWSRRISTETVAGAVDLRREIDVDLAVVFEKDQREVEE